MGNTNRRSGHSIWGLDGTIHQDGPSPASYERLCFAVGVHKIEFKNSDGGISPWQKVEQRQSKSVFSLFVWTHRVERPSPSSLVSPDPNFPMTAGHSVRALAGEELFSFLGNNLAVGSSAAVIVEYVSSIRIQLATRPRASKCNRTDAGSMMVIMPLDKTPTLGEGAIRYLLFAVLTLCLSL